MLESILFLTLIFLIGIVFGSFLNVLIDRIPKNESIFLSRSRCENCKKNLSVIDLFPIFSFIFLKGKCRYCKAKIPKRIFIVEFLTGLFFLSLLSNLLSVNINIFYYCLLIFISSFSFVIFFIDLEKGVIPDKILLVMLPVIFAFTLLYSQDKILEHLIAGLVSSLFFFLLFFITQGKGMGFGDVKLSFLIGLFLGFPNVLVAFYLAFLTGAIISIILVVWGKKNFKKSTIPFAPFLIFGMFAGFFFGEKILAVLTKVLL